MKGCVFVWDYDTPIPIGRLGIGIALRDLRRGLTKRVIHQMTALLGKVVRMRQLGRDTNQMGLDQQ